MLSGAFGSHLMPGERTGAGWPAIVALTAVAGVVALAIACSTAPTIVGPDASMYGAIATSLLHGSGLVFPDAAPVTERPPLFAMATALLGAPSADVVTAAIVLSKAGFVAVATLAAWLAGRTAGIAGGFAVVVLLILSPLFVGWTGATLLDGVAGALALLGIAIAVEAGTSVLRWGLVGVALGLSFLAKETGVLLLLVPLGVLLLDDGPGRRRLDALLAALVAFGLVVLPWFAWVATQTGRTYVLGVPPTATVVAGGLIGAIVLVGRRLLPDRVSGLLWQWRWVAFVVLFIAWVVGGTLALERGADTDAVGSPLRALYRYGRLTLLPSLPFLVIGTAAAAIGFVIALRQPRARPIAIAFVAGLPLLLFIAERGWEARSALTVIVLGTVLAAIAVAACLSQLARHFSRTAVVVGLSLFAIAVAYDLGPVMEAHDGQGRRAAAASWDRPAVSDLAAWLARRTSPGDDVVMSWCYAAMVYVRSGGSFWVHQVPLIRVVPSGDPSAPFVRVATFDGWEDRPLVRLPVGPLVYVSDARAADPAVALERSALEQRLGDSGARLLVVVEDGPTERSGANYPWVGEALGSSVPLLALPIRTASATAWPVPTPASYRSGLVSLDPRTAAILMAGDAASDCRALDALGASAIRIWPSRGLDPAVLEDLRATGRPVAIADQASP